MESSKQQSYLTCSLCKFPFNLKKREPIMLMCCQETACRSCVESKMIKSDRKEVVIKGQFDCVFCSSDHCALEGYVHPIKIVANKKLSKLVEERIKEPFIFCDRHP